MLFEVIEAESHAIVFFERESAESLLSASIQQGVRAGRRALKDTLEQLSRGKSETISGQKWLLLYRTFEFSTVTKNIPQTHVLFTLPYLFYS